MRTARILTVLVMGLAIATIAACTGSNLSGTAGDGNIEKTAPAKTEPAKTAVPTEDPGGEPEPTLEVQPVPPAPGDPGGGGNDEPGDPGSGVSPGANEKTLAAFLAGQPASQRMDLEYIAKYCKECRAEAEELLAFIKAECEADLEACEAAFRTLLEKQRTTAQVRNDQGLVGFPNATQLQAAHDRFQKQGGVVVPVEPGDEGGDDPGAGGDDPGAGGDDPGSGGGAEDPGAGVEPPAVGDIDAIVQALDTLEAEGLTDVLWEEVVTTASDAGHQDAAAAITKALTAIADGSWELAGCDQACVAEIEGLLAGEERSIEMIRGLLDMLG